MSDAIYWSASRIAREIRAAKLTSRQIVEACLERIEQVNPAINAVVQLVAGRALGEADALDRMAAGEQFKGPLHGVPITIKDSLDTEGIVTTGGTLGRRDFVPAQDAPVVARLRAAGAVLLGKTNTPELTFSGETNNLIYGRSCNPYDLARSPGGSSGGSAAIVACGGSALELGSDTGGSIREPAHLCGIAGIKPTSGRTPRSGHIVPYGGVLDCLTQIGPMARYVEDLSIALPLICGPDGRDPAVVPVSMN
ncbi:MAG: amidase, partial [Gammaproteobacteria bacterium]|nr:amidase [Gammaproteobacteria bacterium]